MIKKLNRGAYTLFTPMRYLIAAVQGKMQGTVQGIARTATRASHGLRVKTAIGRISVLNAAVLVQRPVPHCGVGAIVRKPKHNGVARTAVGAVDIGVPVAPVGRIKKFFQASIANSKVGRNADRGTFSPLTLTNGEIIKAYRVRGVDCDFCHAGCGGRLCFEVLNKGPQPGRRAFQVNLNSFLAVQDPSRERVGAGQTIHVRTKANTLHHPANSNRTSTGHCYSESTMQLRPCQPI